jgi:hypothetical protein
LFQKNPTASPTKHPTAWELGDPGFNCNEVCYAIGGTCNVDAINAVDTLQKIQYVVEVELAFPVGVGDGVYMETTSPVNPVFFRSIFTNGFFFYSPPSTPTPATCETFPLVTDRRICCCGATAVVA